VGYKRDQYKRSANLLEAVSQLLEYFAAYGHVPKIQSLQRRLTTVQNGLQVGEGGEGGGGGAGGGKKGGGQGQVRRRSEDRAAAGAVAGTPRGRMAVLVRQLGREHQSPRWLWSVGRYIASCL
jgi:hypothetical protein